MSTITLDLDEQETVRLRALEGRTGLSTGAVFREALAVYADALEQVKETPPYSTEEIAAIEAGLAEAERGELIPHEEVFAELREKYG